MKPVIVAVLIAAVLIGGAASYTMYKSQQLFPPQANAIDCGYISSHGNYMPPFQANATADLKCLYDAYANGQQAKLSLYYMGVDVGTINNFTVAQRAVQVSSVGTGPDYFGPKTPAITYCQRMGYSLNASVNESGLLISGCSDGSVYFIPNSTSR